MSHSFNVIHCNKIILNLSDVIANKTIFGETEKQLKVFYGRAGKLNEHDRYLMILIATPEMFSYF